MMVCAFVLSRVPRRVMWVWWPWTPWLCHTMAAAGYFRPLLSERHLPDLAAWLCGRIQSAVSFRCSPIATEVRTESPKEWGKQASSITQLGQILTVACGNRDTAMGLAGSLYFSSCLSSHPERDILAVGFHFNEVSYLGEYIFVISIKM